MYSHRGYKVEAVDGPGLELEVLGERSKGKINLRPVSSVSFAEAVRGLIDKDAPRHPNTGVARDLYFFVRKYLSAQGVRGELFFFSSVNTLADRQHGTDAFFYLAVNGREYVVTIDLFFSRHEGILEELKKSYPDVFFGLNGGNFPLLMKRARALLQSHYTDFQSLLYDFKRRTRGTARVGRPANHFILTPLDIERGKGLRNLGREIAYSLLGQIKPGPS